MNPPSQLPRCPKERLRDAARVLLGRPKERLRDAAGVAAGAAAFVLAGVLAMAAPGRAAAPSSAAGSPSATAPSEATAAPGSATAAAQTAAAPPAAVPAAPSTAPSTADAAPPRNARSSGSPAAAAAVEKSLAGLASWSADFTQTIDDGHGQVMRSAAGKLYLQRPGKFRWDYTQPSEQLVLADGKQIWFYDKDLAQANVRDMDGTLAGTPAVLLSGGASVSSQFNIESLPPSGGLDWYQLVPKHPDTDFQLVRIGFAKGELASMFLADKLNQVTQLTFTHPQRNAKFPAELFTFVPPAGVDVIGRGNP